MHRRDFLRTALALPLSGVLAPLERLAAADLGKVKITDIKIRPSASHTQIRVDTDAGISGMGESGVTAPMMKAWMDIYKPLLVGQDPLAIGYHWHRMSTLMHTYMARIPAMSGIDMSVRIRQLYPNCKVLLFSGQAATAELLDKAQTCGHQFEVLLKPVHPTELLAKLDTSRHGHLPHNGMETSSLICR